MKILLGMCLASVLIAQEDKLSRAVVQTNHAVVQEQRSHDKNHGISQRKRMKR